MSEHTKRAGRPDALHDPEELDDREDLDGLDELGARLRSLAAKPVAEHPAVLDEVHRAIVAELEDLSAGGRTTAGT